jgi:hypothetical protein
MNKPGCPPGVTVFSSARGLQLTRCRKDQIGSEAAHCVKSKSTAPSAGLRARKAGHAGSGHRLADADRAWQDTGNRTAEPRLCAECHALQKQYSRSPNANAPHFQAVASIPGMTATALSAALNTSHRAMPNIMLPADEQADITAYILSLK